MRTTKPPKIPRTKRRPSVTFKLPTDNDIEETTNDDDDDSSGSSVGSSSSRPKDILETTTPTTTLSLTNPNTSTTKQKQQPDTQPKGDNVNINNNNVAKTSNTLHNATTSENAALMTRPPEDMNPSIVEIDDVAVEPFVAKQNAHVPVAPAFIDEAHRQFSNPISYLGGPLLKPRNRYSIESILSLD